MTCSALSGMCSCSQSLKSCLSSCGRRISVYLALIAPASRQAASTASSSASLTRGMIGATSTPVGTPAERSVWIAFNRAFGEEVRGSRMRFKRLSSVVTLKITLTRLRFAIEARMSASRVTRLPLVTMPTGWWQRSSTSSTRRVTVRFFSIGWYGSVLAPSTMVLGR